MNGMWYIHVHCTCTLLFTASKFMYGHRTGIGTCVYIYMQCTCTRTVYVHLYVHEMYMLWETIQNVTHVHVYLAFFSGNSIPVILWDSPWCVLKSDTCSNMYSALCTCTCTYIYLHIIHVDELHTHVYYNNVHVYI